MRLDTLLATLAALGVVLAAKAGTAAPVAPPTLPEAAPLVHEVNDGAVLKRKTVLVDRFGNRFVVLQPVQPRFAGPRFVEPRVVSRPGFVGRRSFVGRRGSFGGRRFLLRRRGHHH